MTIPFWQSKTFWLNAMTFLIAICASLSTMTSDPETLKIVLGVSSILNLIFRALGGQPLSMTKEK